jgi:hypothetical protein
MSGHIGPLFCICSINSSHSFCPRCSLHMYVFLGPLTTICFLFLSFQIRNSWKDKSQVSFASLVQGLSLENDTWLLSFHEFRIWKDKKRKQIVVSGPRKTYICREQRGQKECELFIEQIQNNGPMWPDINNQVTKFYQYFFKTPYCVAVMMFENILYF